MAKMTLTDLALKQLKNEGKQVLYFDTILPNFGVRVSQKGAKAYIVMLGGETSRKMKTLGRWPDMPLKEARMAAVALLGADSTSESTTGSKHYDDAVEAYLGDVSRRLMGDTVAQYRRFLLVLNFDKTLGEITKADINQALKVYDGKPHSQNYAYAALRCFLNWCIDQDYLTTHPLIRGREPNKTKSRERVLSDKEMARVWRATEDTTYGRMVRVLILTGQRRMEVRNLKPEDVADGLITFHTKGDKINVLPLTPLVEENMILPFRFNNWADSLTRLAGEARVEFRHHDLRRSLATNMARLGVHDIVIERVLGHVVQNVKHTYNRYSYLPEVRDALLRYEDHIRKITSA